MPRFTIDFDDQFDRTLQKLKEESSATTKADVIRKAVASYAALRSELKSDSNRDAGEGENRVSITKPDGTIIKSFIIP